MTDPELNPSELITFVSCIERGRLEDETLLMLKTLRQNGGAMSNARVLLVVGRRGAPLPQATIAAISALGGELVHEAGNNPAPWFNYANKVAAVTTAQRMATTPLVAWLDSDVLVAREPRGLLLSDEFDFAGRCEHHPPAMHSDSRVHGPYWDALCSLVGLTHEDLPLVHLDHVGLDVRASFNSGVFVWRRSSKFAQAYRDLFVTLLRSRLAQHDGNFFTADQVIIGPLLVAHGLRWKHLDIADHHMMFPHQLSIARAAPDMSRSNLIHYSRSLMPPYRDVLLGRLQAELADVHALVVDHSIAQRHEPLHVRPLAFVLKALRAVRWKIFAARARRVPRGA